MAAQESDPKHLESKAQSPSTGSSSIPASGGGAALQLKASLRGHDYATQVQMLAPDGGGLGTAPSVHEAAAHGTSGAGGKLPHVDKIQQSFGGYDISNVQAHTDGAAAKASAAMGADAYATGNHVVFGAGGGDLHTAAHEAAHTVQQKAGVSLSGGVGQTGDVYEKQADAVADRVTAGKSAEDLLGQMGGGGGGSAAVQRRESEPNSKPGTALDEKDAQPVGAGGATQSAEVLNIQQAQIETLDALMSLNDAVTDQVLAYYDWLISNLNAYSLRTGGAPPVRLTTNEVVRYAKVAGKTIVGKVAGNVVTAGVKLLTKDIAKVADPLVGWMRLTSLVGFFPSSIISFAWGIVERNAEVMRTYRLQDEAATKMGRAMIASLESAKSARDSHLGTWRAESAAKKDEILRSRDVGALQGMRGIISAQIDASKNSKASLRSDKSLCHEMLGQWLMQTAEDGGSGGKDTNPVTYAKAKSDAITENREHTAQAAASMNDSKNQSAGMKNSEGNGRVLGPIKYEPSRIFIEQCRYEWGNLGVDATQILAYLDWIANNRGWNATAGAASQVFSFDRVINETAMMSFLAKNNIVLPLSKKISLERDAEGNRLKGPDGRPLTSTELSHDRNAEASGRPRNILDAVMHGKVHVDCRLKVDVNDAEMSAFVRKFSYSFLFSTAGSQERVKLETAP